MFEQLDETNFKTEVITSHTPSVVIFMAAWSGSWHILSRSIQKFSLLYKEHVNFFTVDIEEETNLVKHYNIYQVPTFMLFQNGELIDHVVGVISEQEFKAKLRKFDLSFYPYK